MERRPDGLRAELQLVVLTVAEPLFEGKVGRGRSLCLEVDLLR